MLLRSYVLKLFLKIYVSHQIVKKVWGSRGDLKFLIILVRYLYGNKRFKNFLHKLRKFHEIYTFTFKI